MDHGEGFRDWAQYPNADMGLKNPTDGITRVYPSFWTSGFNAAGETGALIAHDEVHHLGGNEISGNAMQATCLNPQS